MIYDLINPSDKYTIESEDFPVVCAAALLLGQGQYALEPLDGCSAEMPVFLFGGASEWFVEKFAISIDDFIETNALRVAECLDSVLIGNRDLYKLALDLIADEDDRAKYREQWREANRTSMNDIGDRARFYAETLRNYARASAS